MVQPSASPPENLFRRLTTGLPLLITVIVHLVLVGIAGAIVVQQNSAGKKKLFEASNLEAAAPAQVEHRLQVARRSGASGGVSSPVSANRIYSATSGAVALPEMPELPSMGASGFGSFGGMGQGLGITGSGMATSLGDGTGIGGRGFMSQTFLGTTSQKTSKVVFVVDTSRDLMDIRKGGFRAFQIIREEIIRLINRLPPGAQFNVILFDESGARPDSYDVNVNLFQRELVQATSANKKEFFEWMTPVNAQLSNLGPHSATRRTGWRRQPPPPDSGIDPNLAPPLWSRATTAAFEMGAEVIYVVTGGAGELRKRVDEAILKRMQDEREQQVAKWEQEVRKDGLEPDKVRAAREAAYRKMNGEIEAANRKLVASGKDPVLAHANVYLSRADVRAAFQRHGFSFKLDTNGWTDREGKRLDPPGPVTNTTEPLPWSDFLTHISRLQKAYVPTRATLNLFLFVGPNEKPEQAIQNLSSVTKRNGGVFQLITTARLEELRAKEEAAEAAAR